MPRPPAIAAQDKVRIVLSIVSGELTSSEAARRAKVSETTIGNWKRQFLDGGAAWVEAGGRAGPNTAERALLDEVEDLKAALGEAHVELRVWKKSAEYRLGPSRTSR
jgi:transposase